MASSPATYKVMAMAGSSVTRGATVMADSAATHGATIMAHNIITRRAVVMVSSCHNPTLGLSVKMQLTLPKVGKWSPLGLLKT